MMKSSRELISIILNPRPAKLASSLAALTVMSACTPTSSVKETAEEQSSKASNDSYVASAEISNPSSFAREKSPLYFSYADLGFEASSAAAKELGVLSDGKSVASQLVDKDANGTLDGIAVALDLGAEEVVNLEFTTDPAAKYTGPKFTQAEISNKEGGEWVAHTKTKDKGFKEYVGGSFKNVEKLTPPKIYTDHSNWIRYEGPGIESDKVGYRVYLDWRNGYDIFGKSVPENIMQLVGQDGYESYHHMQDWGMDILKVGQSLGAGSFGRWDGKQVNIVSEVEEHTATITNNGPIYSSFNIFYDDWKVDGKTIDISSEISMVAGSRLAHAELNFSEATPQMAIGVVKHKGTELIESSRDVPGDSYVYIASWGKQALSEDNLGMAVFVRKTDFVKLVEDKASYAATIKTSGNDVDYYFAAAWQGEHGKGIATKEAFVKYLEQEVEKLNQPPRVRLKSALSKSAKAGDLTAEKALGWSKKLADSELERKTLKYFAGGWDTNRQRIPRFEYDIIGLQPTAYDKLGEVTGEAKYSEIIEKVTGTFIGDKGEIAAYDENKYNIDSVAPGTAVMRLYKKKQDEKYKIAAAQLRRQLKDHPRTSEGAFWHKQKYPWQLWLDGVYMGMPFLTEYLVTFEDGKHLEEVAAEFAITRKYLRDPETGLYFHAWDEKKKQPWADPETGLSRVFWARGIGWLSMALVDVLDFLPEEEAESRQALIDMINELAVALVKYQDKETNTWWQVLDMPNKAGNYRESSSTAMLSYFFSKAVNNGYLDASYKQVAIDTYKGLINEFVNVHPDGSISMTNQCLVAGLGFGRIGDYNYYMTERVFENDPKGNGPFILAGIETYKLLK